MTRSMRGVRHAAQTMLAAASLPLLGGLHVAFGASTIQWLRFRKIGAVAAEQCHTLRFTTIATQCRRLVSWPASRGKFAVESGLSPAVAVTLMMLRTVVLIPAEQAFPFFRPGIGQCCVSRQRRQAAPEQRADHRDAGSRLESTNQ